MFSNSIEDVGYTYHYYAESEGTFYLCLCMYLAESVHMSVCVLECILKQDKQNLSPHWALNRSSESKLSRIPALLESIKLTCVCVIDPKQASVRHAASAGQFNARPVAHTIQQYCSYSIQRYSRIH